MCRCDNCVLKVSDEGEGIRISRSEVKSGSKWTVLWLRCEGNKVVKGVNNGSWCLVHA